MQLSHLIQTHNELTETIVSAIDSGDDQLLIKTDQQLTDCMDNILRFQPTADSETYELVEFLLSQLVPATKLTPFGQRLMDKIKTLVEPSR